jgi:chemotaxis protein MotB
MSRKKRPEHPNHERWLVSYADFITLLFAFFVVLYSSAQVDVRKVGELAKAIQSGFQEMGVFDATNTRPSMLSTEKAPFPNMPPSELDQAAKPDLTKVQQRLESALAPEIQKHTVSVTPTKEGIVVSLRELGFFDSGSTSLRPEAMPALAAFVKVAGPLRARIRIEGHTDNVPIHNERFDSNWELSTARATEIIKLFISKCGIAPERLSASGYGEYYPVASNSTAEGRALNRRVDLVILGSTADSSPQLP